MVLVIVIVIPSSLSSLWQNPSSSYGWNINASSGGSEEYKYSVNVPLWSCPSTVYDSFDYHVTADWTGGTIGTTYKYNTTNGYELCKNCYNQDAKYPNYFSLTKGVNLNLSNTGDYIEMTHTWKPVAGFNVVPFGIVFATSATGDKQVLWGGYNYTDELKVGVMIMPKAGTTMYGWVKDNLHPYKAGEWYQTRIRLEKATVNWTVSVNITNATDGHLIGTYYVAQLNDSLLDSATWFSYGGKDYQSSGSPGWSVDEVEFSWSGDRDETLCDGTHSYKSIFENMSDYLSVYDSSSELNWEFLEYNPINQKESTNDNTTMFWKCNGGATDENGLYNGTVVNAVQADSLPNLGNSYYFDGSGDYIKSNPVVTANHGYSISTWMKSNVAQTNGDYNVWYRWSDVSGNDMSRCYWTGYGANNIRCAYGANGGYNTEQLDYAANIGTGWHHYVMVHDDSTKVTTLYLDGAAVATDSYTGNMTIPATVSTAFNISFGDKYFNPLEGWNGYMDEMKVYDFALTAQQVKQMMTADSIRFWDSNLSANVTSIEDTSDWKLNDSGMVLNYDFSEGAGTTLYDKERIGDTREDGTITGAAWSTTTPQSQIPYSLYFDDSGDRVAWGSTTSASTNNYTWVTWYNPIAAGGDFLFIKGSIGVNYDYGLYVESNKLRIFGASNAYVDFANSEMMDDAGWKHVVVTKAGTRWELYVNGTFISNQTLTSGNPSVQPYIGGDPTGYVVNGRMTKIKIFNRTLSASEIASIYDAEKNGLTSEVSNEYEHPTLTSVSVTPNPGFVNETLTCTPTGSADSYLYKWFNNTVIIGGQTASTLALNSDYNSYNVTCQVTPYSGGSGVPLNDSVIVYDYIPDFSMTNITPTPAYTNDTLSVTVSDSNDATGGFFTIIIRWFKNAVLWFTDVFANKDENYTAISNTTGQTFDKNDEIIAEMSIKNVNTIYEMAGGNLDYLYSITIPLWQYKQNNSLTSSAKAGWHLDEASGKLYDWKGRQNLSTNASFSYPSVPQSDFKKALYFNEDTVANSSFYNVATNNGTIMGWVSTTDTTGAFVAVEGAAAYPQSVVNCGLYSSSTGVLEVQINKVSGTQKNIIGTTVINDGKWHFFACVKNDTDTYQLFVDGKEEKLGSATNYGSHTDTWWDDFTTDRVRLGNSYLGQLTGRLDEIAIYDYALTREQIGTYYNQNKWKFENMSDYLSFYDNNNELNWEFLEYDPVNQEETIADSTTLLSYNFNGNAGDSIKPRTCNATVANAVQVDSLPLMDRAYYFDGTDDTVTIPSGCMARAANQDYSISFWEKKNVDTRIFALGKQVDVNNFVQFDFWNDGEWSVHHRVGGTFSLNGDSDRTSGSRTNDNNWHFITIVWSGTNFYLYEDGVKLFTKTSVTQQAFPTLGYIIGTSREGTSDWNGYIDDFKLWNKSLSDTEIQKIMNFDAVRFYNSNISDNKTHIIDSNDWKNNDSGMVINYDFSEAAGTTLYDKDRVGDTIEDAVHTSTNYAWSTNTPSSNLPYSVNIIPTTTAGFKSAKLPSSLSGSGSSTVLLWFQSDNNYHASCPRLGSPISYGDATGTNRFWSLLTCSGGTCASCSSNDGTSRRLCLDYYSNQVCATASPWFNYGEWVHAAVVTNGTTNNIFYKNGVFESSVAHSGLNVNSAEGVKVGWRDSALSNQMFAGNITGVKIFNRILSASEIAAIYNAEKYNLTIDYNVNFVKLASENTSLLNVSNSIPTVENVSITPTTAYTDTTLTGLNDFRDVDGDTDSSKYRWFKNNTVITNNYEDTLNHTSFKRYDNIIFEVTPNDGTVNGTRVNSSDINISDSLPSVENVTISPTTAYTNSTLTGDGDYRDVDSDTESGSTYKWFKNNTLITDNYELTLNSTNIKKNDNIIFEYTPKNTLGTGTKVNSSTKTISNYLPSVENASVIPTVIYTNDTATCDYDFRDIDLDSNSGTVYKWYNNNTEIISGSLTFAFDDITSTTNWRVNASDTGWSWNAANDYYYANMGLNYNNRLYYAYNISPSNETIYIIMQNNNNENFETGLVGVWPYSDWGTYNGALGPYEVVFNWPGDTHVMEYDDNFTATPVLNVDVGMAWVDEQDYCLKIEVHPLKGAKYWRKTCDIADTDITDSGWTLMYDSSPEGNNNGRNRTYSDSYCGGAGCIVKKTNAPIGGLRFFANTYKGQDQKRVYGIKQTTGVISSINSATLGGTYFEKNDNITCEIKPMDGISYGTKVNSSSKIINNTIPTFTYTNITPNPAVTNDTISVNVTVSDRDENELLTIIIRWFKNLALFFTQIFSDKTNGTTIVANLSGDNFSHYDNITVEVIVGDDQNNATRENTSNLEISNTAPVITTPTWMTIGGYTSGTREYGQSLDYIQTIVTDLDGNNDVKNVTITVKKPSGTKVVDESLMTNISTTYTYGTNILLNEEGTWLINITTTDGNLTRYNETNIIVTITPVSTVDGYYGFTTTGIPTESEINNSNVYGFDLVEITDNITTLNANWASIKDRINDSYNQNVIAGLNVILNVNCSNTTAVDGYEAEINTNLPDLLTNVYQTATAYVSLQFLNQSYDNGTIVNNCFNDIAQAVINATNNQFIVYNKGYTSVGLDEAYIQNTTMQYNSQITQTTFINWEANTVRTSDLLNRVYNIRTQNSTLLLIAQDLQNKAYKILRTDINDSTSIVNKSVGELINGDLLVFNNLSTPINYKVIEIKSGTGKDVYDKTNKRIVEINNDLSLDVYVGSYSVSYLLLDNFDHYQLNSLVDDGTLYKATTSGAENFSWDDGSRDGANQVTTSIYRQFYLYDPKFVNTGTFTNYYGWLNVSQVQNWSIYDLVVIADKNKPEIRTIVNTTDVYGYIAVSNFNETNTTWLADKKEEVDSWFNLSIDLAGIFVDGLDRATITNETDFEVKFKSLVDYIRIDKGKKALLNTYTYSENYATWGDGVYKESCVKRWNGVNASAPTSYTYEDWNLELNKSNFFQSHNVEVYCVAFNNKTNAVPYQVYNYTEMVNLFYASKVLGYDYFTLGQPDFQYALDLFVPDVGTDMANSWSTDDNETYYRAYSNGIIYYNTSSHIGWQDDDREITSAIIYANLHDDASVQEYNITVSDGLSTPLVYSYNTAGGGWAYNYYPITLNTTYNSGRYKVTVLGGTAISYLGLDTTGKTNQGIRSWYSIDSGITWTGETENYMYMFSLEIDDVKKASLDSFGGVNQTNTADGELRNITLSGSSTFGLPVWSMPVSFTFNDMLLNVTYWNGTRWRLLTTGNTSDCDGSSPTWTEDVIDGDTIRSCYESLGDNYTFRVAPAHLSNQTFQLDGNNMPTFDYSLTNLSLHHHNNLSYDVNCSDVDNDTIIYHVNDTLVSINSSTGLITDDALQSEDGSYNISVSCDDGLENVSDTFIYVIVNDAPKVENAVITPNPAYTNDTLNCAYDYSDNESDANQSYISWYVNGVLVLNDNSTVLLHSYYNKSDNVSCNITGYDGWENGSIISDIVNIDNTLPTYDYTQIIPNPAYTNDTLQVNVTAEDIDVDIMTIIINWFKNLVLIFTDIFTNVDTNETVVSNLSGDNFSKYDNITVEVIVGDAEENNTEENISSINISNRLSEVENVTIIPNPAYTNSTLIGNGTFRDIDVDDNDSTYKWFKNNTVISNNNDLELNESNFKKGDTIIFEFNPGSNELMSYDNAYWELPGDNNYTNKMKVESSQSWYFFILSLNNSNFDFSTLREDGGDIRVVNCSNSSLPYWVEDYTPNTTLVIRYASPSMTNCSYIYWGNENETSLTDVNFADDVPNLKRMNPMNGLMDAGPAVDLTQGDSGGILFQSGGYFGNTSFFPPANDGFLNMGASLFTTTEARMYYVMVKPNATSTAWCYWPFQSTKSSAGGGYGISIPNGTAVQSGVRISSVWYWSGYPSQQLQVGQWYPMMGGWAGSAAGSIYMNVKGTSSTGSKTGTANENNYYVGWGAQYNAGGGGNCVKAWLDEGYIWNVYDVTYYGKTTQSYNQSIYTLTNYDTKLVLLNGSEVNSTPLTISNIWSTVENVSISPNPAYTNDTLSCNYDFRDIDGDSNNSIVKWFKNDSIITINYKQTIPNFTKTIGVWQSGGVKVYDGNWSNYDRYGVGTAYLYENWSYIGKLASATWRVRDDGATIDLTLPLSCYNQNPLQFMIISNANYANWSCWNGSQWLEQRYFTSGHPPTDGYIYENNVSGVFSSINYLSESYYKKNDNIICEVTPNDGVINGTEVNSSDVNISNNEPTVENVTITPLTAYTNTTLTGSGDYRDIDGDASSSTYKWFKNNTVIGGEVTTTLLSNNFKKYDNIIFEFTPNDGIINGVRVNSSQLNINNYQPTFTYTNITPNPAYTNDTLQVNVTAEDIDLDIMTVIVNWFRNLLLIFTDIFTNVDTNETVSSNLTGGNFSHYDNITAEVIVEDGTVNTTEENTSTIEIQDLPPDYVIITSPTNNTWTNDSTPRITFETEDVDGDLLDCTLYANGTAYNNNASVNISDTSYLTINTSLRDGPWSMWISCYDGNQTTSSEFLKVLIDEAGPYFTNAVNTSNGSYQVGDTFTANITISDVWNNISAYTFAFNMSGVMTNDSIINFAHLTGIGDKYKCVGSFSNPCTNAFDSNWNNYASGAGLGTEQYIYVNYSNIISTANILFKTSDCNDFCSNYDMLYCYNYSKSDWSSTGILNTGLGGGLPVTLNGSIPTECLNNNPLMLRFRLQTSGEFGGFNMWLYEYNLSYSYYLNSINISTTKLITATGKPEICWEYWANDSLSNDNTSQEYCFNVLNTPPVVTNVNITPNPAYTNDTIVGDYTYNDVDLDTNQSYNNWYINDLLFDSNITNLSPNNYSTSDEIIFEVIPYDGENFGVKVNSSTLTISDTPPIMLSSRITPTTAYTNDTLLGYCNATDVDGDNLTYHYRWFINGTINNTGWNNNVYPMETEKNTANYTPKLDKHNIYIFSCLADDNTTNSTWFNSTSLEISNLVPDYTNTSIIPSPAYTNDTLSINVTVTDVDVEDDGLITVIIKWFKNLVLRFTDIFTNVGNGTTVVSNLSESNFTRDDNITVEVTVGDEEINTTPANISNITIINIWPTIENVTIVPSPALATDILNCTGDFRDLDNDSESESTWRWFVNDTYVGNGSSFNGTNGTYVNGDLVICEYTPSDTFINGSAVNSSVLTINNSPLSVTLYKPVNGTRNNTGLVTIYEATDLDGDIVCNLTVNGTFVDGDNIMSKVNSSLNATPALDGSYWWNVSCTANGNPTRVYNETRIYEFDTTSPTFSNYANISYNGSFIEIGDIITMNITATDRYEVAMCGIEVNTTGVWANVTSIIVSPQRVADVTLNYTVPPLATHNNSRIGWRYWCNDSLNQSSVSSINYFVVNDTTYPAINSTYLDGNNWLPNYTKQIKGMIDDSGVAYGVVGTYLNDLTLNFTYFDYNLFQVEEIVDCELNGTLYNYTMLDYNDTTLNVESTVSLNDVVPQMCRINISASDDHTADEIPEYDVTVVNNGLNFETENNNIVTIQLEEDSNKRKPWFGHTIADKVKSIKQTDRYNFEFNFDETKDRTFVIKSNNKIYYRENSEYPAHFVIWNEELKRGNWIDFAEANLSLNDYNVNKVNDYEYEITIKGLEDYLFESIGGTNVWNASFLFFTGASVNLTTFDRYSQHEGARFSTANVTVTTIDSYPGWNGSGNIGATGSTWLENVSNGTYLLQFDDVCKIPQNYTIDIQNISQLLYYNSSEAEIDLTVRNIVTGASLTGYNVSIHDVLSDAWINYTNVSDVPLRVYLNASNYTVYIWAPLYDNYSENITLGCKEHLDYKANMHYLATFFLYDEKTLDGFNMSSPDAVYFHLFCENSTSITLITSNVTTLPITCNYTKFRFVLDYSSYSSSTYYRSFIVDYSTVPVGGPFNYDIFLIDARTTSYVSDNFIVDDLMDEYEDTSVFIYKWIGATRALITSDYIDIESKVAGFLIQNHEYIIEVHSSNNPIRIMGNYVAAASGDKALKLYEINLDPTAKTEINNIHVAMGSANMTNETTNSTDLWAILYVNGSSYTDNDGYVTNITKIKYNLMLDSCTATPFYTWSTTDYSLISQDIYLTYNLTPYANRSVCSNVTLVSNNTQGTVTIRTKVKLIYVGLQQIQQEIFQYVSHNWMNWFLLLLLGAIAIMGTIRNSSYTALLISLMGALLAMFGWFAVGLSGVKVGTIIVVSIVISLIAVFKTKESNTL